MLQAYKTDFPRDSFWDNEILLPLTKDTALPLIRDMLASQYYVTKHGDSAFYYLKTGYFTSIPDGERRYHRIKLADALKVFLVDSGITCETIPDTAMPTNELKYGTWAMDSRDLKDSGWVYYYSGLHTLFISGLSKNQFIDKLSTMYSENELKSDAPKTSHKNGCCVLS